MKKKSFFRKFLLFVLIGGVLLVVPSYVSYFYSKMTVIAFTGKPLKYLEMSSAGLQPLPFNKATVWWRFTFNLEGATDECIIYTDMLGDITETSPRDLASYLRRFESLMLKKSMRSE